MVEKKIPWWRKALNFALEGIRSGFGLFSRPAKPEPVTEPAFSGNLKDNQEEEAVLSDPFPQPEIADAAEAIPAEPEAEPTPAAEVEPSPEPVGVSEIEAEAAPAAEPIPVSAPAIDEAVPTEPIPAEAEQAEAPRGISDEIGGQLSSGAKQAAEKGLDLIRTPEKHPSGPKGPVDFAALTARLKSCPDTKRLFETHSTSFSAACKARVDRAVLTARLKSCPDTSQGFSAACEATPLPAAEPDPVIAPEAVTEAASEPIEGDEAVVEAEPEPAPEPAPEPIAEVVSEQAPECAVDSEPEAGPVGEVEVPEAPEAEAMDEAVSEPVEAGEPVTEAEPEAEPEAASEPVDSTEPAVEAEREAAAEQTPDLAPAPDVVPPLVLTSQLMADEKEAAKAEEKAAAKLAARQKRLDESSEQSPFSVIVGKVYDGPLDLLLDLIRKQDIDIYDIPIARITAQFLAYVNQLKAGDVDVAGEFIYTASLLIHIKSRMLLPRAASGPEDEAEDPRRELVERLLEHERFKNAAQMLQQKQMLEAATWSNPGASEFKDDAGAEPEIAADTVDLVRIFRDILERARKRPAFDVEEDSVTVGQMIQFLARRLTMEDKPVALRRLLSHTRSERALIAMFLALLELVRLQAILLRQDRQFSEIFIKKNTDFDTVMNEGLGNARDDWR
jgi:segregation and condensation protein A